MPQALSCGEVANAFSGLWLRLQIINAVLHLGTIDL